MTDIKSIRNGQHFDSSMHGVMDLAPSFTSRLYKPPLVAALQAMPSDVQDAFQLRHGEEFSIEEVAIILEVSFATVKRYLVLAEQHLREKLGMDPDVIGAWYRSL